MKELTMVVVAGAAFILHADTGVWTNADAGATPAAAARYADAENWHGGLVPVAAGDTAYNAPREPPPFNTTSRPNDFTTHSSSSSDERPRPLVLAAAVSPTWNRMLPAPATASLSETLFASVACSVSEIGRASCRERV